MPKAPDPVYANWTRGGRRIEFAILLILMLSCFAFVAIRLIDRPRFEMHKVYGLDEDGYFQGRRMIPDQVRAMSEVQE